MLNCLAAAIPAGERVVTCEEVFELPQPSWPQTFHDLSVSGEADHALLAAGIAPVG